MAGARGEQRLAIELLVMAGAITARDIAKHHQLPHPRKYVGALALFGVLSAVGKISDSSQRLADILGAVVVLAYLLSWARTDPAGITAVTNLPAAIASGKGLPTAPTKQVPHEGIKILGELLELLVVASALRGGASVIPGGGSGGGGEKTGKTGTGETPPSEGTTPAPAPEGTAPAGGGEPLPVPDVSIGITG